MTDVHDVLVVGAGPTGLTVAGDLAAAGHRVAVLERRPEASRTSRAFAVMPRTMEVLQARGLSAGLLPLGTPARQARLFGTAQLDLSRTPSAFPFGLITPQSNVDAALGRYAEERGAAIHRGVEMVDLDQDGTGVRLTTRPGGGTGERTWRGRYVVAADGAHSSVRQRLGVPFPGRAVLSSAVLADVKLAVPPAGDALTMASTPDLFCFLAPYGRVEPDGAWYRMVAWDRRHQVGDDVPVPDEEIHALAAQALLRDPQVVEIAWRSRFHCDERQVRSYRHGRVFLAGDAAHVHSPVGGQGMNTGIQDAANLSWKLSAALRGAGDAVLDTYQAERHPIGRRVVLQSGLALRAITLHPRAARWLRDRVAGVVLGLPAVQRLVLGSFAGTGLRYSHGRGEDRLVGTPATRVPLRSGELGDLQQGRHFVLVSPAGTPPPTDARAAGVLTAQRRDDGPMLLVRPDGYVAWASSTPGAGWRAALARWTGR